MVSRFVPLDQVTAEAASLIGAAETKDRLLFKQWVYTALREIGVGKQNIDTCILYPKDFSFTKPQDMTSTIDIALYNSSNAELNYKYNSGRVRIHQSKTQSSTSDLVDLSEDDFYFHLGSNGSDVAYARIRYFKFPVDDDGLPKIPEDQVFAIMMYIRYAWSMRKNDNRSEIDQNRQTWLAERDRAKSRNKMPSMLEGKQIAKEWMSMIQKPFFNNF